MLHRAVKPNVKVATQKNFTFQCVMPFLEVSFSTFNEQVLYLTEVN